MIKNFHIKDIVRLERREAKSVLIITIEAHEIVLILTLKTISMFISNLRQKKWIFHTFNISKLI